MTAKSLTGLEKAAVLLKSLPAAVVDKVLKHMDAKQAGILVAELEKLKNDTQLSGKLADVLEEAAKIIESVGKNPAEAAGKVNTPTQASRGRRTDAPGRYPPG